MSANRAVVLLTTSARYLAPMEELHQDADELTRHPNHIHLGEFYLLPQFQRQGIGTHLLGQVLDEAGQKGFAVRLEVLKNNPVQSLYKRHGFLVVGQREHHFLMECIAP